MILATVNHSFKYELEKLCRVFLPHESVQFTDSVCNDSGDNILTLLEKAADKTRLTATLCLNGNTAKDSTEIDNGILNYDSECERLLAVMLYNCFVTLTGYTPPWGILTGVRPAKLFSRLVKENGSKAAREYFKNNLFVSDGKIDLCDTTFKSEENITALSRKDSFSLYVSIPFCPTRCSYCSFVSHSVDKAAKLMDDYLKLLKEEIELTGKIAKAKNLKLQTIYIGGGTPTTLSANQLDSLIKCIKQSFCLDYLMEFTVEAGRPDTVTLEKLKVLKENGVLRISINPQTLNDSVLCAIGRAHTVEQFYNAYSLAKQVGFKVINTDLIAGLPQDTLDSFKYTVDKIIELDPQNVTVHALSLKRAADLSANANGNNSNSGLIAAQMVDYAREKLNTASIQAYYMYRQSKTVGNLENVGYSKKGYEGLYNIYIMDETHSILACGASAVTKLRQPGGNYIERIFNFKYPYEYISRFNEIIERKEGVLLFYDKYGITDK